MTISDNQLVISAPAVLSDGNGGYGPCPELLTAEEAARYLRLDGQKANSAKTLQYYREKKKLRPTKIGKHVFYSRRELDNFIQTMTG